MALAAVMCVALMGCEDSGISSTDVDLTDPPLTVTKNEPEILVNEFLSKAEIFVERVYGLPWSELSKMDVSELPEIEGEKSSEQVEESWKELQVVMKELASYNGTMTNIIAIHEAVASGKEPDISSLTPPEIFKANGCEDHCHAKADLEIGRLYRTYQWYIVECTSYGLLGSLLGTPITGGATLLACSILAIRTYYSEEQTIKEDLELCLMQCQIPEGGVS